METVYIETKMHDPIVEEVWATREELLKPFGGNPAAYLEDLIHRQREVCAGYGSFADANQLKMTESASLLLREEPPQDR